VNFTFTVFIFFIFMTSLNAAADIEAITVVEPKAPADFTLQTEESEDPDPAGLFSALPNVSATSGSNRPRFFQIRGVGETSQFEHSQVSALGIFYEGIDLSEEASALPLLGRENIAVEYGPRTLNWGAKAFAGAMSVSSPLANESLAHRWQVSAANYATHGLMGGSKWSGGRLQGFTGIGFLSSDGFYKNTYLDKPTGKRNEFDLVLGLEYSIGRLNVRQHHLFVNHRNGYDSWSFSPSFETLSDHPGRDGHQVHGHSFSYALGPWSGLTSLTVTQQEEAYDEDWGNNPYWNSIPGWNADYNYFSEFERRRVKLHQKLERELGAHTRAGLHFYKYGERQLIRSYKDESLRRQTEPHFTTENLALWMKTKWRISEWTAQAGLRAEQQWIELEGLGDTLSKQVEPMWSADLRLSQGSNELMLARGYRGAGYNTTPELSRDLLPFGPEEIYLAQLSHERTSSFARGTARVFHQWRERQQVRSSVQTDPMDPSTFTYYTENEGSSRSFGVETAGAITLAHWTLSSSLGWMQSRFRDREAAQAPAWTYSARLEYARQAFRVYTQIGGREAYFLSDDHDFKSKPYHLVDAGAAYDFGDWDLRIWAKNIFDQEYPVRAFYFANEPPAWENKFYTQLGDPRTFGAQLVFEY
jgi:iron complex outermembrane recepter protein